MVKTDTSNLDIPESCDCMVRGRETVIWQPESGCYISYPFRCVGRGRVRVVTHGSNLPRHGTEAARRDAGLTQPGVPAKTAGRSIKRMVQLRDVAPDGYSWESPVEGQIRFSRNIRRSSHVREKASVCREAKGMSTCRGPGVGPSACGER